VKRIFLPSGDHALPLRLRCREQAAKPCRVGTVHKDGIGLSLQNSIRPPRGAAARLDAPAASAATAQRHADNEAASFIG